MEQQTDIYETILARIEKMERILAEQSRRQEEWRRSVEYLSDATSEILSRISEIRDMLKKV